jgi:hypothetical protein
VGLTLTFVVITGAFWKGDREQQVAAVTVVASSLVTLGMRDPRWLGVQWAAFGADVVVLAVITFISFRTRAFWPLVAAAFQLLCVMTHVARTMDPAVHAWAYATAQVIFTHLFLIAIGVGVVNTWLASRRRPRAALTGA